MRVHAVRILVAAALFGFTVYLGAAQAPAPSTTRDLKALARQSLSKIDGDLLAPGLREPVEVIRDKWGVPHIYAQNVDDLFFAQGYVMGQDRLWQLEMWRRQREGRLAEILGPRGVRARSAGAPADVSRPVRRRRSGPAITPTASASSRVRQRPERLHRAAREQPAGRVQAHGHQAGAVEAGDACCCAARGFGDASSEMQLARLVARVGAKEANRMRMPDPWDELTVPEGLDVAHHRRRSTATVRRGGRGGRRRRTRRAAEAGDRRAVSRRGFAAGTPACMPEDGSPDPGSNNWVVGGSEDGDRQADRRRTIRTAM